MTLPEVNACTTCDRPADGHGWRGDPAASHRWAPPTDGLRKLRLLALRRERRIRRRERLVGIMRGAA